MYAPFLLVALLSGCTRHAKEETGVDAETGDTAPVDADGDGAFAAEDCDDADPDVIDPTPWYPDVDGDGYGVDAGVVTACLPPDGTTAVGGDCADDDATVYPSAVERCDTIDNDCDGLVDLDDPNVDPAETTWYRDRDGDGHGDASVSVTTCDASTGYVHLDDDCDDDAADLYPGAPETCDDEDNDCDGLIDVDDPDLSDIPVWFGDADGDGWGDDLATTAACDAPDGSVAVGGDCDDANAGVRPDAVEVCATGDEDCDGLAEDADPDVADPLTWYADGDADGWGDANVVLAACDPGAGWLLTDGDCDDAATDTWPGAPDAWYDGVDANCDGADDSDADADGFTLADDCDDTDSSTHPGAPDAWYDGIDADCDDADDYDADADGSAIPDDCDDADATIHPGASDAWYDGVDANCDGADDDDADADGYDLVDDCDETDATRYPGAPDAWYDGIDADCDGANDFDQDADGVELADDCDDTDPNVYPGATDAWYDGDDSNCDGANDYDADADGYDAEPWGADCDDGSAIAHPGGTEVWYDGIDGDCDELSDYDADADGYDAEPWGADCDDADVDVSPGASEGMGDGVDQDCDGLTDGLDLADAGVVIRGTSRESAGQVVSPGDFDGDGTDDVFVDAYTSSSAGANAGANYVFTGPVTTDTTTSSAWATIRGTTSTYAGVRADTAGDLDGDGADDLILGSFYLNSYRGGGWIVSGVTAGVTSVTSADGTFSGVSSSDNAGYSVSGVGDLTGDGRDDVLVGAYNVMPGSCCAYTGAAYLLAGPATGSTTLSSATAVLAGQSNGDHAGEIVTGLGDVDGDGIDDVAISAVYHGSSYRGTVYVEHGPLSGSVSLAAAPLVLTGASASTYLGSGLGEVGDVDGDGLDDIAVGGNGASGGGANSGGVYLFTGARSGSVTTAAATATFSGGVGDYLGSSGAITGADWDGDGLGDILLGALTNDTNDTNAGAAYLFIGPLTGSFGPADAYATLYGEGRSDYFGSALSPLGDQDGDGLPEILVGASQNAVTGTYAGAAYIVFGSQLF